MIFLLFILFQTGKSVVMALVNRKTSRDARVCVPYGLGFFTEAFLGWRDARVCVPYGLVFFTMAFLGWRDAQCASPSIIMVEPTVVVNCQLSGRPVCVPDWKHSPTVVVNCQLSIVNC